MDPGSYLEFVVRNCSSVYLLLYNSHLHNNIQETIPNARHISQASHLSHLPISEKTRPAFPIFLLSRIDNSEYQYFNRTGKELVAIASGNLEPSKEHIIRIMSPNVNDKECAGIQFIGIWLNKGGMLVSPQEWQMTTQPAMVSATASTLIDDFTRYPKDSGYSRQDLKMGKIQKTRSRDLDDNKSSNPFIFPQKTLEIVTDVPNTLRAQNLNSSQNDLQGWEDMVGDLFGIDHVSIMLDRMCLTSPCMSTAAQPASIQETYFRRFCSRCPRFASF